MQIRIFGIKITIGNTVIEEILAGLFKAQVGKDPVPDHLEINRAFVITVSGMKFAVDIAFRRVEK
ncbi:MAG TPA: hypothetical protein PLE61_15820 [Vicinamibacterales bacterium]|nr:hypothetical protein [Vicinamibacterales bacterium]